MTLQEAQTKANKLQDFIGKEHKGLTIEHIIPVTTENSEIKMFVGTYLSTKKLEYAVRLTGAKDFNVGIICKEVAMIEGKPALFGGWFDEAFPDYPIPE